MRGGVIPIMLLTRIVDRISSFVSTIQSLLYGLLPVLLPPQELEALTRNYYSRSYRKLQRQFQPEAYLWTLEQWEEDVMVNHMAEKGTVLVLGAGLGRESIALAQRGYRVAAIDNNHDGLCIASTRASSMGLPVAFIQGNIYRLPLKEGQTDYVFLSGVMYSSIPGRRRRQECVHRFRSILKGKGKILLNFLLSDEGHMQTNPMIQRINRWLQRLPGSNADYQLGDFCSHGHFMHTFHDMNEIQSELAETGATVLELNWREGYVVIC